MHVPPESHDSPVMHTKGSHFEVFLKLQALHTHFKGTIIKKNCEFLIYFPVMHTPGS